MLESYIKERLKKKDILLMTHIVLGYPDFKTSMQLAEVMVEAGVDLMELQIPFSEPIADGPMIMKANEQALDQGATVAKCFKAAQVISSSLPIPFLFVSYYNILYQYGVERFAEKSAECGIQGIIVPDAPPEEAPEYISALNSRSIDPIQFFTPNTSPARMNSLADKASGFIYCIARKGVTGQDTNFSTEFNEYLNRCRETTSLPLALGFGLKTREDIDYLKGKVDIAVIGSHVLRVYDDQGLEGVDAYLKSLR